LGAAAGRQQFRFYRTAAAAAQWLWGKVFDITFDDTSVFTRTFNLFN
jgi:hypothetical protein